MLALENFQRFVDRNPEVRTIELGSKGEALLNPRLPAILEHARERGVAVEFNHGVNLNTASDEVLEAIVRCRSPRMRVSIDGATQETYARYRVGGDLGRVLRNVQKLNGLKRQYGLPTPRLTYQFIVFRHNVHEMQQAAALARMLDMTIQFHLNAFPEAMADGELDPIRKILGFATRGEYEAQHGRHHYMRHLCYQMWVRPQVNWDGRLLGCCKNFSAAFAGNVFEESFRDAVNGAGMERARRLLQGAVDPSPEDLPCASCFLYQSMRESGNWIQESEIAAWDADTAAETAADTAADSPRVSGT